MDFELDDLQVDLTEGFSRLLDARCDSTSVRALADVAGGVDPALWAELAAAGLFSLAVPESRGGAGLGWAHVVLACEQLGRRFVPGPFAATITAAVVCGDDRAAAGERVVTYAERGTSVTVIPHLRGSSVVWFVGDDRVDQLGASEIEAVDVAEPYDPLTPVAWTTNAAGADRVAADAAAERVAADTAAVRVAADAAAVRCALHLLEAAQLLGLASGAGELSVKYAGEREQFGRPIGSFQAVKHLAADQLVRTELARAAVYAAAVTWDSAAEGPPSSEVTRAVVGAKLLAAEAALNNAKAAVQIHGGMGYTWEVDAHLLLKRAYVLSESLGGREALVEAVAATL